MANERRLGEIYSGVLIERARLSQREIPPNEARQINGLLKRIYGLVDKLLDKHGQSLGERQSFYYKDLSLQVTDPNQTPVRVEAHITNPEDGSIILSVVGLREDLKIQQLTDERYLGQFTDPYAGGNLRRLVQLQDAREYLELVERLKKEFKKPKTIAIKRTLRALKDWNQSDPSAR